MAILKVKDENGNIIPIPAIQGKAGAITDVSATIDNTSGEPAVEVTMGGNEQERTFAFAFTGLKGPKGDEGGTTVIPTTEDPGAGATSEYPDGTVILVYE